MARRLRTRPAALVAIAVSAALFLGTVALPAAGGTTAFSALSALKTAKKALRTAKKADKRARKALKKTKEPGPQGIQGAKGDKGAPGVPGTARAYGLVTSGGTLVAARSKNASVDKFGTAGSGDYCVTPTAASGIDGRKTVLVATPDISDGPNGVHIAQLFRATNGDPDCLKGFLVSMQNYVAPNFTSADIAFSFVIP